jgi:hypothetical protein
MRWGAVDQMSMGRQLYELNNAAPGMNLKEVDATLHWMSTEVKQWKGAHRKLWGRLKRRQEELLGLSVGSGLPRQGRVRTLSKEAAEKLDELRRLKAEPRGKGA